MSLYVPTPEVHARFAASGMTRYSHAEISAAAAAYEAAAADYDALAERAMTYVVEHAPYGDGYIGWELGLPTELGTLLALLDSGLVPGLGKGGRSRSSGSSEEWPVRKWEQDTARYRRLTQRIQRALETAARQSVTVQQ